MVTLLTLDDAAAIELSVHAKVEVETLALATQTAGWLTRIFNNVRRLYVLRSQFKRLQPDAVVSFVDQANVLALIAATGLGIPVVVSERVHPRGRTLGPVWRVLRRLVYPRAARVVVQSRSIGRAFETRLGINTVVIANPVSAGTGVPPPADAVRGVVVAIGRLTRQKGFDLLIRAYADIRRDRPGWRLEIYGEGPDRVALEHACRERGLDSATILRGATSDAPGVLCASDIFVLPSRFEGMPNVLLEAMASGLPVIACNCPGAVAEILDDGRDGRLVPVDDARALAAALLELIDAPALRRRLGAAARAAVQRYAPGAIIDEWNHVLDETVRDRAAG